MADLSITAANVAAGADAVTELMTAAVAVTAGQAVYRDESTGKVGLADSNSATAQVREVYGVTLNPAAANQPVLVQKGGSITIGATLTAGVAYYLSDTPGGLCPVADVGSGEYVTLIGVATTSAVLKLTLTRTGVAL